MIMSGVVPEPATWLNSCMMILTRKPETCSSQRQALQYWRYHQARPRRKPRYDLRSQDDAKSFLQFARELVSEYHDAAFLAECLRDVKKRPVVIDMDPQVDDADTDHAEDKGSVSTNSTDLVVCQRARNSSPVIRNRQTTIRPRPMTQ